MLLSVPASDNDRVGGATVLDFPGESIFDQICSEHWMVWKTNKQKKTINGWHGLDLKQ